ncbi:MAG TPA: hypothetical protein VIH57_19685 [Bacteroidales bacterium]
MNYSLKKEHITNAKHIALCVVIFLILTQCNTGNQKGNAAKQTDTLLKTENKDTSLKTANLPILTAKQRDSLSKINFMLPSPDEILSEIIPAKTAFNSSLVNPRNNIDSYLGTKYQSLNLGVYLTDFAYLNLNDQKNDALEYFKTVRDLAQKVNIYGLFNQSMYDRIQNNLTRKDSLGEISKEVYYKMLDILESAKRNNIYALIASGAIIEALYISTMTVKNYTDYQKIAEKIFEQKYLLDNFSEFTSQFDEDKDVRSVLIDVIELKKILESSPNQKTEKKVLHDKKDHIIINGGEEVILDEATFKKFKDNIIRTRNSITNAVNK